MHTNVQSPFTKEGAPVVSRRCLQKEGIYKGGGQGLKKEEGEREMGKEREGEREKRK